MAAQETPYWDAFRDTGIGKYLLDHEQTARNVQLYWACYTAIA
jgi:hypothetical protein